MSKFFDIFVNFFILCVIIFTSVCTFIIQVNVSNNTPLIVDKEFISILNEFKMDAKKYNITPNFKNMTTVFVSDISGDVLAYCIPRLNTIRVSRHKWNRMDLLSRKILLYHEWGHCTLKREHVTIEYSDYISVCPDSIMYPYMEPIVRCYHLNTNWYDKELFTNFNNRETIP